MENNNANIRSDKFVYTSSDQIVITKKNGKDQHRYLSRFPLEEGLDYLIIGTIHPNGIPLIDYFYGNVASLWSIIKQIYPTYSFNKPEEIREWQGDFKIGITDTVTQCQRKKDPVTGKDTARDSDLILEDEDYNWALKDYILNNRKTLKRLLFTSGNGENAAFKNFKKIMGKDFELVEPICTVLSSPSGNSTRALYKGKAEQYGLVLSFYDFLKSEYSDALEKAKQTFEIKRQTQKPVKRIPDSQVNYYEEYKVFEYKKHFPKQS